MALLILLAAAAPAGIVAAGPQRTMDLFWLGVFVLKFVVKFVVEIVLILIAVFHQRAFQTNVFYAQLIDPRAHEHRHEFLIIFIELPDPLTAVATEHWQITTRQFVDDFLVPAFPQSFQNIQQKVGRIGLLRKSGKSLEEFAKSRSNTGRVANQR